MAQTRLSGTRTPAWQTPGRDVTNQPTTTVTLNLITIRFTESPIFLLLLLLSLPPPPLNGTNETERDSNPSLANTRQRRYQSAHNNITPNLITIRFTESPILLLLLLLSLPPPPLNGTNETERTRTPAWQTPGRDVTNQPTTTVTLNLITIRFTESPILLLLLLLSLPPPPLNGTNETERTRTPARQTPGRDVTNQPTTTVTTNLITIRFTESPFLLLLLLLSLPPPPPQTRLSGTRTPAWQTPGRDVTNQPTTTVTPNLITIRFTESPFLLLLLLLFLPPPPLNGTNETEQDSNPSLANHQAETLPISRQQQ
ncbi:mucin-2-like [Palaemon carinicauda]|uniref:mucin-2-like n=1 Tax=Palaemon carinicauda TaxID=392227 RepID=UPI0035B67354